ncbi:mannose-6-phosphate isomerase [Alteromonas pelagimontana]|uniref:Mannose-6-phosphate isomerase n=1 Tax=Alteromonas pelagimontana TaxID=1858656 RepID=A0A6M4MI66_9ALTE|nr:AGE family epimerase/isomerase [Alteromonas pelagimontana]QJR82290.1 mannose-6-phosphate isomerase [Alteromonas pelagimontana]
MNSKINNCRLVEAANAYDHWLGQQVFPVWLANGFEASGASIETFTAHGHPDLRSHKRIRVQARQMFCVCYGQTRGWTDSGSDILHGIDSFLANSTESHSPGFYPTILNAENQVIDTSRDLYDCAFFLLAYAWRYRVFHDLHALKNAHNLINIIEHLLKGSRGGWKEGDYAYQVRRQNPHMHLFEAFMALYESTRDAKWLAYAGEMFALFETVFFDEEAAVLREFFTDNWQPDPARSHVIEPGHMMEWVWLLYKYGSLSGKPVHKYCTTLYRQALKIGLCKSSDLLLDAVTATGEVITGTKRCWPMTEWVKAALAMTILFPNEKNKSHAYVNDASNALSSLMRHYRHPERAGHYIDRRDEKNNILDASMPASTLYHLCMTHNEVFNWLRLRCQ